MRSATARSVRSRSCSRVAQQPKLLLLDEPTAGLAPGDASLVTEMLKREQSRL